MSKRNFSKKEVAISIAAAALAIATVGGAVAIHKDSSKDCLTLPPEKLCLMLQFYMKQAN